MEGTPAAIRTDSDLDTALDTIIKSLRWNEWETVTRIETPLGVHGVTYACEENEEFASIGMVLPEGVYAEIEDGTYGQLQAFRFYKVDL